MATAAPPQARPLPAATAGQHHRGQDRERSHEDLIAAALAATLCAGAAWAQPQSPGPTLSAVKQRDILVCGTSTGAAGFSTPDSRGEYRGLDSDLCRATAAAVLGDPTKVRWVPLTSTARLPSLQSGQVDVLIRTTTWTQVRDTANGLNFTAVSFYDGQGFLLRKSLGLKRATELQGASICVTAGSTNELNLADWARINKVDYRPVVFEQNDEARRSYLAGRCDAYSTDASQLAGLRSSFPNPEEHVILPDIISKEPHAPVVRHGDDQWFDIVRWTFFALLTAEELGVTQANVRSSVQPEPRGTAAAGPDRRPRPADGAGPAPGPTTRSRRWGITARSSSATWGWAAR